MEPVIAEKINATSRAAEEARAPSGGRAAAFGRGAAAAAGALAAAAPAAKAADPIISVPNNFACANLNGPSSFVLLARKASFGYTQQLKSEIAAQGYGAWLNAQINYPTLPGWVGFESRVKSEWDIDIPFDDPDLCSFNNLIRNDLVRARVARAIASPAQLFERMVEFWTDHLNTWHYSPEVERFKSLEDRDAIRPNALGKLKDLLRASATSPAMLNYLNGNGNDKGAPNENYARELLELHTLGADVCYDEAVIAELAKALTGWRVKNNSQTSACPGLECGQVCWNDGRHDQTAKTLVFPDCFGPGQDYVFTIPAGLSTDQELERVLFMLTDPDELGEKTARFIAVKMAKFFHRCNPPGPMIDEMWTAYRDSYAAGGADIAAMVKKTLASKWIQCSKPILKRPLHLAVSALRAIGTDPFNPNISFDPGQRANDPDSLVGGFLNATGHIPFNWPAPDGYPPPCDQAYWGANQLTRWNLGASLFHGEIVGLDTDALDAVKAAVEGFLPNQPGLAMNYIDQIFFAGHMPDLDKVKIRECLEAGLSGADALGLAVGSPGFQWY